MGKNIKYGDFTFNKPNPRPSVKGYAFGGEAQSAAMAARKSSSPSPAPMMSPSQKLSKDNQTFVSKLNAADGKQRLVDPDAMNAAVQRRDYLAKATKTRLADEARRNAMPVRSQYRQDQMGQGKANLLPSNARAPETDSPSKVMPFKEGGEVKGYALGGMSALAKAKAPATTKPTTTTGQMPAYAQNFANQAKQTPTSLSGMKLPSPPPMMASNSNQMGALSNLMRQYDQQKGSNGFGSMIPPPPMAQPMGGIPAYAQAINQPMRNIPNFAQPYINQASQPIGYPPPPPTQQPMGGIPSYAQPFMNQANQSPVNAPTQAGMPPQAAGMGLGMGMGASLGFKKGGDVSKGKAKAMESSSKDKSQDKAMIKKAMKQHDQQEHKGGKGTVLKLKNGGKAPIKAVKLVGMKREPIAMVKKEVSLLKKAGAPAKMIKEEMTEAIPAMACGGGMRKGGAAMKKGVPTFNRTPKC